MLDYEQFSYADDVWTFVNEVLKGDYETITEGVNGYTVWYIREEE